MAAKHEYYYDQFVSMVECSCSAADYLHETLQDFNMEDLSARMSHMHRIEHQADTEKHEMMKKLAREFITPIEREDIIQLAQEIDEVTDSVEDVLMRIYMYRIKSIRQEALDFTTAIVQCCKALKTAMEEFHNFRRSTKIHDCIVQVNSLEELADDLYIKAVHTLYGSCHDPIEVMAWTETFERLERCCDSCEHVANLVESVIMKNS
ncbi:MAG TPA: DUF47 domain-containing protein [Ruminococcaceae bacterium]|nr:DUF47 domain-containing protein [Oscillospiraceae bacterium]